MSDVVSPQIRSCMMSGIRAKNTKPELVIRRQLHALGFRYRLHDSRIPGKPDIVFSKYNAVVFIHGCFWHVHKCHLFKWPKSREEFWNVKLSRNKSVDEEHLRQLLSSGWRVLTIWECSLKGKDRLPLNEVIQKAVTWLHSDIQQSEIRGVGRKTT